MPSLEAAYGYGKPVIYPDVSPYKDYLNQAIGYPIPTVEEKIERYPIHFSISFLGTYRIRYWDVEEFAKKMISVSENPAEALSKASNAYKNQSANQLSQKCKIEAEAGNNFLTTRGKT